MNEVRALVLASLLAILISLFMLLVVAVETKLLLEYSNYLRFQISDGEALLIAIGAVIAGFYTVLKNG